MRPEALRQLQIVHIPTTGFRSKSWVSFQNPMLPNWILCSQSVINAAKEVCPVWPGQPMTAHWGVPGPAAVNGAEEEAQKAFKDAFLLFLLHECASNYRESLALALFRRNWVLVTESARTNWAT